MTDETRAWLITMGKGKQVETYDKVLARYLQLKKEQTNSLTAEEANKRLEQ